MHIIAERLQSIKQGWTTQKWVLYVLSVYSRIWLMAACLTRQGRLDSLDILRGLDMVFLTVAARWLRAAAEVWGFSDPVRYPIMRQVSHYWGEFTAYDVIMPLFIFMCGAAIPFALGRRLADGRAGWPYWRHVLGRVALLWVLGMMTQGDLLTLDPMKISPYNNTLQTIAAGYLIAAVVYAVGKRWLTWVAPIALAGVYGAILAYGGDYTQDGNVAQVVEQRILTALVPAGSAAFTTWGYTWFLTTFMFGAMTLAGLNATEILRRTDWTPRRRAVTLFGVAAVLAALGFAAEACGEPSIKQISTFSFTAEGMGLCVALLAVLYVLVDVWGCHRGWGLVRLFGQNALACYLIAVTFKKVLVCASETFFGGFARIVGAAGLPLVLAIGQSVILVAALWIWQNYKKARRGR